MENNNGQQGNMNANVENEVIEIENDFDELVGIYMNGLKSDEHSRSKSYEILRKIFIENRGDESKQELIAVHLFAFLANWGMCRKGFLLNKDYLFSLPVVEILCKDDYKDLLYYNPFVQDLNGMNNLLLKLVEEIKQFYADEIYKSDIKKVSEILVSKIILGTFGCIIAFDTNVTSILPNECGNKIDEQSINWLNAFAKRHKDKIENHLQTLNEPFDRPIYTPMKVIDMYLFEKGLKNN